MNEILLSSVKYPASDWIKVLLLGLVIFLVDLSNDLGGVAAELGYIVMGAGFILGIYQVGFIFRIVEETTHGSDMMPTFGGYFNTFIHGLKEALVTVIYFIIPFILIIVGTLYVDDITGPKSMEFELLFVISGLFLASLMYLVYQAVVLNMANHHGTIRSAFDLKNIFKKVKVIGLRNLGFIYIFTVIFAFFVEISLSDVKLIIPYGLGELISAFIIAPFILIFIARTLGLINRTLEN